MCKALIRCIREKGGWNGFLLKESSVGRTEEMNNIIAEISRLYAMPPSYEVEIEIVKQLRNAIDNSSVGKCGKEDEVIMALLRVLDEGKKKYYGD